MLRIDLKTVIKDAIKADPDKTRFGWIPYMAKTWVGRFLAESFSERMISHANIVMKPGIRATNILQLICLCSKQCINQHSGPFVGNCTLNPKEMEMLVVLRMNRRFMEYMRTRHKKMSIEAAKNCWKRWRLNLSLLRVYKSQKMTMFHGH